MKSSYRNVRREQRKSLLFREVAQLISQLSADDKNLSKIYPTRIDFSSGNGVCYIYFSSSSGEKEFDTALETLKLYKPSIKKAIAKMLQSRHTPDVIFKYDKELEKELYLDKIFEEIKSEDKEEDQNDSE